MRSIHTALLATLVLGGASSVNAKTSDVNRLTAVDFSADADTLTFTLRAKGGALDPADVSANSEETVLNLRVENAKAKRRWVETDDAAIVRTLLHPSKHKTPAAVLRVRMTEAVPDEVLRNIVVRDEDGALVVVVPRSAEVVARWESEEAADQQAAATPAPAEAADALVLPPIDLATAPAEAAEGTEAVEAEAPVAAAEPVGEATPLDLPPVEASDETQETVVSGLPGPDPKGPSLGAVAMAMLFLGVIGFFLWRRMRGASPAAPGGRMIKPVGSHMMGPKHSLLLVDVAGQLVLLGSGDKGVQMLTTIPRNDSVEPSVDEIPLDAMPPEAATTPTFADRLGRAVARIREAARTRKDELTNDGISANEVARDFVRREKEAVAAAAEEDLLSALADGVDDEVSTGRERMRQAARAPRKTPPKKPEPRRADLENDLLQKIRRLQSA